ncbi:MAG: hypothetical protein AAGF23_26195 [Acidobacteriota bacterium]
MAEAFNAAEVVFSSSQPATEEIAETFDSWVVALLASRPLTTRHSGETGGLITVEGGATYAFSGRVLILGDGVMEARYDVVDHPTVRSVAVESSTRGQDVWVTVESTDRSRRVESFSFEL